MVDQEPREVDQEPREVDQTVDQEPREVDQEPREVDQEALSRPLPVTFPRASDTALEVFSHLPQAWLLC